MSASALKGGVDRQGLPSANARITSEAIVNSAVIAESWLIIGNRRGRAHALSGPSTS
jgi:hypothetical protein